MDSNNNSISNLVQNIMKIGKNHITSDKYYIKKKYINQNINENNIKNRSNIKVYIYSVLNFKNKEIHNTKINGIYDISYKYKFSKIKKSNIKTNKSIQPNNPEFKNNILINKQIIKNGSIFTKDILEDSENNENNIILQKIINEDSNLKELYNRYLIYSTRIPIEIFNNNYKNSNIAKLNNKLINDAKQILSDYLTNKSSNLIYPNINSEIIYRLNEDNNSKIIVIGDNHGGLHSFFRIIIRFIILGIIDKNFKLKNNYKIIFLGDIIDRGNFSSELIYIILKLIIINNNKDELKVIFIRGNHEDPLIYARNGFEKEIRHKYRNKSDEILLNINKFFSYCPSAVILSHKNINYWLCHGGFEISRDTYNKSYIVNTLSIPLENELISYNEKYDISQIRWNDFTPTKTHISYDRLDPLSQTNMKKYNFNIDSFINTLPSNNNLIYNIGKNELFSFLNNSNIDFIIRGHTDNVSNAMLLSSFNHDIDYKYYILNNTNNIKYYNKFKNTFEKNNPLKYTKLNGKSENEIVTIYPEIFERNIIKINDLYLYPVLTISNNSDNKRNIYPDSYIIISDEE
jgi:hypothetical protein